MNLIFDDLAFSSFIATLIGIGVSAIGVLVAWLAKEAADDAKKAVKEARERYAKNRNAKKLIAVYELARNVQEMLGKYRNKTKIRGIGKSEFAIDVSSLDKLIMQLNNDKYLVESKIGVDVEKNCEELTKLLKEFSVEDDKKVEAATQIRRIVNNIVPKIQKVVEQNDLDEIARE